MLIYKEFIEKRIVNDKVVWEQTKKRVIAERCDFSGKIIWND